MLLRRPRFGPVAGPKGPPLPQTGGVRSLAWVDVAGQTAEQLGMDAVSAKMLREWSVVLQALRIPHRIAAGNNSLLVPGRFADVAAGQLAEYALEPRQGPAPPPRPAVSEGMRATAAAMLLLVLFHAMRDMHAWLPGLGYSDYISWVELGGCWSADVLSGHWFRTVTALTLHGDAAHLAGNAAIGGCFLAILSREVGSGIAWLFALLAGAAGNYANCLYQGWGHHSIGFSTAVFAAAGILGGLRAARGQGAGLRGTVAPVVAALAFLAMLGMGGENPAKVDVSAHVMGLGAGVVLGLAAGLGLNRFGLPGPLANAGAGCTAAMLVVAAWAAALTQ